MLENCEWTCFIFFPPPLLSVVLAVGKQLSGALLATYWRREIVVIPLLCPDSWGVQPGASRKECKHRWHLRLLNPTRVEQGDYSLGFTDATDGRGTFLISGFRPAHINHARFKFLTNHTIALRYHMRKCYAKPMCQEHRLWRTATILKPGLKEMHHSFLSSCGVCITLKKTGGDQISAFNRAWVLPVCDIAATEYSMPYPLNCTLYTYLYNGIECFLTPIAPSFLCILAKRNLIHCANHILINTSRPRRDITVSHSACLGDSSWGSNMPSPDFHADYALPLWLLHCHMKPSHCLTRCEGTCQRRDS